MQTPSPIKRPLCNVEIKKGGAKFVPRQCSLCGLGPCDYYGDSSGPNKLNPADKIIATGYGQSEQLDFGYVMAHASDIASKLRSDTIAQLRAFHLAGIRVVADHRMQDGSFSILVSPGDFKRMKE